MSIFDIEQYLDTSTTDAAQKRELMNPNTDYIGEITDVKSRSAQGKKDTTMTYLFFDYTIVFNLQENPQEHARIGVDKLTLKYGMSVDLVDGRMDWSKGKNNGLRILREALNQNVSGQLWNPRMPVGHRIRAKIKWQEYPEGSGNHIENIATVAKV